MPQLKYTLGSRYGMHTHKLLTDSTVASSGNGVLAQIDATALPPTCKLKVRTHALTRSQALYNNYSYLSSSV